MGEFLSFSWNYSLAHILYGIQIVNVVGELEYSYCPTLNKLVLHEAQNWFDLLNKF